MTHWLEPSPIEIPASLAELGLPPFIEQTLVRRGILTSEAVQAFLHPEARPFASPYELPGMQAAVERMMLAIRKKEQVCVWGDFDVDGQTATALLVQTLQSLGAHVTYHIPIRAVSSHGVHIPQLAEIIDRGVRLLLTCDTGITAHEAVDYARSRGVDFVITDHHEPGSRPGGCCWK